MFRRLWDWYMSYNRISRILMGSLVIVGFAMICVATAVMLSGGYHI